MIVRDTYGPKFAFPWINKGKGWMSVNINLFGYHMNVGFKK